ncbi:MAG: DUF4058 family protein [Acidobacteria bacterium]|nr:DUF4058 family protein [Acidobacteriota bacterium]
MPVHDWRLVETGTFRDFHTAWITHLKEALNEGLLPEGYYALSEQHAGAFIGDVLALHQPETTPAAIGKSAGGLALAEAPPKVRKVVGVGESYRMLRKSIAVRHVSGHRLVALIEIVSKANKDRPETVAEFVDKAEAALTQDINLLLVDLFPPGKHDPNGMHGAIWKRFSGAEPDRIPVSEPVALASYHAADRRPYAYLEFAAFGKALPEMPVFLLDSRYVNVPLESTYRRAFKGLPAISKEVLEKKARPAHPRQRRPR